MGIAYATIVFEDDKTAVDHVTPYILMKDEQGKESLVEFDGYHSSFLERRKKLVINYNGMRADNTSCGMFTLHALKHCLLNPDFIKCIFEEETKTISLDQMFLVEHSEHFEDILSTKVRNVYLKDEAGKSQNLKAFYKCRDALRKILNAEEYAKYEGRLNPKTREAIRIIDEARCFQKIKEDEGRIEGRDPAASKASASKLVAALSI